MGQRRKNKSRCTHHAASLTPVQCQALQAGRQVGVGAAPRRQQGSRSLPALRRFCSRPGSDRRAHAPLHTALTPYNSRHQCLPPRTWHPARQRIVGLLPTVQHRVRGWCAAHNHCRKRQRRVATHFHCGQPACACPLVAGASGYSVAPPSSCPATGFGPTASLPAAVASAAVSAAAPSQALPFSGCFSAASASSAAATPTAAGSSP